MHSFIFELAQHQILHEKGFGEDPTIANGDMVSPIDYATLLSGEKRKHAIDILMKSVLPKGMFTLNPDGESMTYNGGIGIWRKSYLTLLHDRIKAVNEDNILDWIGPAYQLQKAIVNPLDTNCLFIVDSFNDFLGPAERSSELMRLAKRLKKGDVLYFGLVFDYHF